MKTLDEFFSRYGSPAREANETIHIYNTRADCINSLINIKHEDERAARKITEMLEYIEVLKEYRKTLYERAQEICAASYRLQLKIKRNLDTWHNKKWYIVSISKIYENESISPEIVQEETFEGKERYKALKRFESLRKEYPNVEAVKQIDKYQWER